MFCTLCICRIVRALNQDFFKTWSPEMAYVLGYFAADGSMVLRKNGGCYIEFTSIDRVLLEKLQFVVGSAHTLASRDRGREFWSLQYRIQIGSREWFKDLFNLGFTQNKSNTMSFPYVPSEYLGDFVRGYFDGDGCVYFSYSKYTGRSYGHWILQTSFTSGSERFLSSLLEQLRGVGIRGGSLVKKSNRGYGLKLSKKDSLALSQFMYNTGEISGLFLPRKREKLERAVRFLIRKQMRE